MYLCIKNIFLIKRIGAIEIIILFFDHHLCENRDKYNYRDVALTFQFLRTLWMVFNPQKQVPTEKKNIRKIKNCKTLIPSPVKQSKTDFNPLL